MYHMMMHNQRDFFAGLMYCAAGTAFAVGATNYSIGTGARMGPGYFPLMLGVILGVIGVVIMLFALRPQTDDSDGKIGAWAWKPVACIIGANLLFGVAIGGLPSLGVPSLGMIVGIYALVTVASLASESSRMHKVLMLATVLAAGSYLAFIVLLKLQIPVWPSFIV